MYSEKAFSPPRKRAALMDLLGMVVSCALERSCCSVAGIYMSTKALSLMRFPLAEMKGVKVLY